jgi:thiamine biosynthesis lipoprotein
MMMRCQALLGTFVEICTNQDDSQALDKAFAAVKQIQDLMGFHCPLSELNQINHWAQQVPLKIHSWTAQVLRIAQEVHKQSNGLFNCGVGHRLVSAGLLPRHMNLSKHQLGGIEDVHFLDSELITSPKPLCLDLGGIAKGFAVDKAVESLIADGLESGFVNAGGDLRVFGQSPRSIHIRNPIAPMELIDIGSLQNGAIATSGLYFTNRDRQQSHIINPFAPDESKAHIHFSGSYSILANECVYADALTKVLALSSAYDHPCLNHFSAQAIRIAA